jgi:hypothetical protein
MDRRQLLFIGVIGLQVIGCHFAGGSAVDNSAALCKSDVDCATDARCTVEHGVGSCRAHDGNAVHDGGLAASAAACTSNAQCRTGEACEIEGGVGSCKPQHVDDAPAGHDDAQDAGGDRDDCEHAQGTPLCASQRGDDGHGDHDRDDDAGPAPPRSGTIACTSDADCAPGDECKHQDEHGSAGSAGTCTPYDGDHGGAGNGSDGHG